MNVPELVALFRQHTDIAGDRQVRDSILSVEQDPSNPYPVYRLAELCRERRYDDLWRAAALVALSLPHTTHQHLFHRGEVKLMLGDWSGWLDRESRLFNPAHVSWQIYYLRMMRWSRRPWDGRENITDKTIFLVADGSDTECSQTMLYVSLLVSQAQHVIFGVRPDVVDFTQYNLGDCVTVTDLSVEPTSPFDRYAWLLSLPVVFGSHHREFNAFSNWGLMLNQSPGKC